MSRTNPLLAPVDGSALPDASSQLAYAAGN